MVKSLVEKKIHTAVISIAVRGFSAHYVILLMEGFTQTSINIQVSVCFGYIIS